MLIVSVTDDMKVLLDVFGIGSDLSSYLGPPLMHYILGTDFGGSGLFDYSVVRVVVDQTPTKVLMVKTHCSILIIPIELSIIG